MRDPVAGDSRLCATSENWLNLTGSDHRRRFTKSTGQQRVQSVDVTSSEPAKAIRRARDTISASDRAATVRLPSIQAGADGASDSASAHLCACSSSHRSASQSSTASVSRVRELAKQRRADGRRIDRDDGAGAE